MEGPHRGIRSQGRLTAKDLPGGRSQPAAFRCPGTVARSLPGAGWRKAWPGRPEDARAHGPWNGACAPRPEGCFSADFQTGASGDLTPAHKSATEPGHAGAFWQGAAAGPVPADAQGLRLRSWECNPARNRNYRPGMPDTARPWPRAMTRRRSPLPQADDVTARADGGDEDRHYDFFISSMALQHPFKTPQKPGLPVATCCALSCPVASCMWVTGRVR